MDSWWLDFFPSDNGFRGEVEEMGSFRASPTMLIEDGGSFGVPVVVSTEVTRPLSKK
jgi:hypothetical protein